MAEKLEIHHLNVGQGESTLIVLKDDSSGKEVVTKTILIDGGERENGAYIIKYYRRVVKDKKKCLDYVIISHLDRDHWMGIRDLIDSYNPNNQEASIINNLTKFYNPPNTFNANIGGVKSLAVRLVEKKLFQLDNLQIMRQFEQSKSKNVFFKNLKDALDIINSNEKIKPEDRTRYAKKLTPYLLNRLDVFYLKSGEIEKYNEGVDEQFKIGKKNKQAAIDEDRLVIDGNKWDINIAIGESFNMELLHFGDEDKNDNYNSLCWLLNFHNFKYYTGGDAESDIEDTLSVGNVHVFKAAHHGSHNGTSTKFIKHLKPKACIISCGNQFFGKTFKNEIHPSSLVLDRLLDPNLGFQVKVCLTNFIKRVFLYLDDNDNKKVLDLINNKVVGYNIDTRKTNVLKDKIDGTFNKDKITLLDHKNKKRSAYLITNQKRNNKSYYWCLQYNTYRYILAPFCDKKSFRDIKSLFVSNPIDLLMDYGSKKVDRIEDTKGNDVRTVGDIKDKTGSYIQNNEARMLKGSIIVSTTTDDAKIKDHDKVKFKIGASSFPYTIKKKINKEKIIKINLKDSSGEKKRKRGKEKWNKKKNRKLIDNKK